MGKRNKYFNNNVTKYYEKAVNVKFCQTHFVYIYKEYIKQREI